MAFSPSWRAGFELELVLGDLNDPRFAIYAEDPLDEASPEYCKAVASQLAHFTQRRWLAAHKKQRRTGYFVYPEYDLDPLHWPRGLAAGVELVTPPVLFDDAEALREQIAGWVYEVDGDINTYRNSLSHGSGWHINVDPGSEHRIDVENLLVGADELPALLAAGRYPSVYSAPQRHSYGVPLLQHVRSQMFRPLLDRELGNFLRHYGGYGKRYAMNLSKLENGYLELRHFGADWFFRDQPLAEVTAPFLRACEMSSPSCRQSRQFLLAQFEVLAGWADRVIPQMRLAWTDGSRAQTNSVCGVVSFGGEALADVMWSGTATCSIRTKTQTGSPTIYDQAVTDLPLSLAVLALDVAEIRGRKLGRVSVANKAFSLAIDDLTKSLRKARLLERPQLMQSVFWTPPPYDPDRIAAEAGLPAKGYSSKAATAWTD